MSLPDTHCLIASFVLVIRANRIAVPESRLA
jgi:hypothetical protein